MTLGGMSLNPDPFDDPLMWNTYAKRELLSRSRGDVKSLQKYDLTHFIKWGKMKTKQLLLLS